MINDCFEFDWSCGKIEKIVKNEEEMNKVKAYLRNVYKHM